MIIGFIGFGKVAVNLTGLISSDDISFVTSLENRSENTRENVKRANVEVLESFRDVAIKSDILISTITPKSAVEVSSKYGKYCSGIYLDLNNISPKSILEINNNVSKLVDGSIIGKIDSENPIIYLSGKHCDELMFLNEYVEIRKISDNVGDASILKLLRSTYTKTVSAVLIESYELSKKYGLEVEFFESLELTESEEFKEKSLSRINNTLSSSNRKREELEEILDYFGDELEMVRAALRIMQ